jgi:hypothetical protein
MSKETVNGKAAEKEQVEEFVAIEVDGKGNPIQPIEGEAAGHDSEDDDDELGGHADDDEEERLGHGEDDDEGTVEGETLEAKRERRRRENKAKRIRNRTAAAAKDRLIENQGRMLLNLQEQVAGLQGRTVQYDVNLLQNQLVQIEAQQTDAKAVLAKLVTAQDGEGVAEITELQHSLRDQHRMASEQLRRAKAAKGQQGKAGGDEGADGSQAATQPARPRPNPQVIARAEDWAKDNRWFNPKKPSEEADIVRAVDANLHREGWNPATDEYWEELTSRIKRRLPHHFKKAGANGTGNGGARVDNDKGGRPAQGGPRMATASQSGGRSLGKNEVRVNPDRKAAMQAAGKWDDPVKRNRQLAAYAKYDREQAGEQ